MEKVSTQLGHIKDMLVGRGKDPTYTTESKESLTKPLRNSSIEENFEEKPNLGSGSAEEATDNASFKSAKDELDGGAEEQSWEFVEEQERECVEERAWECCKCDYHAKRENCHCCQHLNCAMCRPIWNLRGTKQDPLRPPMSLSGTDLEGTTL